MIIGIPTFHKLTIKPSRWDGWMEVGYNTTYPQLNQYILPEKSISIHVIALGMITIKLFIYSFSNIER